MSQQFFASGNLQLFLAGTILSGIAGYLPWFNTGNYFTMLRRMDTKDAATLVPPVTSILCGVAMCVIVAFRNSSATNIKMYSSATNPDAGLEKSLKENGLVLALVPLVNYFVNRIILRRLVKKDKLEVVIGSD